MNKAFLRVGTTLAILAAPLPALAEPIHALLYKNCLLYTSPSPRD